MHLVILRHSGADPKDLPLALFMDYVKAEEYAKDLNPDNVEIVRICELLRSEAGAFCNVSIITFDRDGWSYPKMEPVNLRLVKTWQ